MEYVRSLESVLIKKVSRIEDNKRNPEFPDVHNGREVEEYNTGDLTTQREYYFGH